jgi:hypothetical protein
MYIRTQFQNAHKQYSNMDKLMARINGQSAKFGVSVRYGTIDEYFRLINTDATATATPSDSKATIDVTTGVTTGTTTGVDISAIWPTFDGDFFPLGTNNNIYSSDIRPTLDSDNEYWTGHYTTREYSHTSSRHPSLCFGLLRLIIFLTTLSGPLMKGLTARANGMKHTAEIAASISCAQAAAVVAAGEVTGTANMKAQLRASSLCGTAPNTDVMLGRTVTSLLQVTRH